MDFKQLEAYVKVVELGSFSKAAEALYISQPSISTYVRDLENLLGAVLINRSTKVLSTTLAGERFYEQANKMLRLKQESIKMLRELDTDISGSIRILASSVPAQFLLPAALAKLHAKHPDLSFKLMQADTAGVVQGIAAFKADIGFVGSVVKEKKCQYHELTSENLLLIAPNNGQFSPTEIYDLQLLLYNNSFVARELGSGTRMQYEKWFAQNGIDNTKLDVCAAIDSTQGIISAVSGGMGISMVSELAAKDALAQERIVALRLRVAMPQRKIYMVLNKNIIHSHLVKLLMEHMREQP